MKMIRRIREKYKNVNYCMKGYEKACVMACTIEMPCINEWNMSTCEGMALNK